MANFYSRYIFFSTSPRNPMLVPEYLKIIQENGLENKIYNNSLQEKFYEVLSESEITKDHNTGNAKDKAFAGRDKMTRLPQTLGFLIPMSKKPLEITPAGKLLMNNLLFEDVFTHQLLKFQLPSPLHKESKENKGYFNIKPFLELLRLIYKLEYLTYQELELYGMSMTDYHDFDKTVENIKAFRKERNHRRGNINLKKFYAEKRLNHYKLIYKDLLEKEKFKTRESTTSNEKEYMKKKLNNLADYTDSVFRSLKSTGLLVLTRGKSLKISQERLKEVEYILKYIPREGIKNKMKKEEYLRIISNPTEPKLLLDNPTYLKKELDKYNITSPSQRIYDMKLSLYKKYQKKRYDVMTKITYQLKKREQEDIDDIINVFQQIKNNELLDSATMLEWNTWRAANMINHGNIIGNFIPDDNGYPISHATGNQGDIVGDYGKFSIVFEVTLTRGKRQYDAEGEPVPRHVGSIRSKTGKESFGIFIANPPSKETIYHFYMTTLSNSEIYGGSVNIIPFSIDEFIKFFKKSIEKDITAEDLYSIHKNSVRISKDGFINNRTETDWYRETLKYIYDN